MAASWAAGALYACTDEIHQMQTAGRTGQWTDVMLDSGGVLAGVLAAILVLFMIRRKHRRKETEKACP